MKAVILASEKSLLKLCGIPLAKRLLYTLRSAGLRDVVVVTGSDGRAKEAIGNGRDLGIRLVYVESLSQLKGMISEGFLLLKGNYVIDQRVIERLAEAEGIAVAYDSEPHQGEGVKVFVEGDQLRGIGPDLEEGDGIYVGAALCEAGDLPLFAGRGKWFEHLAEMAREKQVAVLDVAEMRKKPFWFRIDSERDTERCKGLLAKQLPKERDGIVSRHFNRRLSIPLSLWLASHSPITANQMSFISFLTAIAAAGLFSWGNSVTLAVGGTLAQLCSILDGCDGELARLRGTASAYGAWFDAVLDRWADALLIGGMTYAAWSVYNAPWVLALGFLTLAGAFGISYSESQYEGAFGEPLPADRGLPAKRDTRLFLALLGGLTGQVTAALSLIAGLSIAEVVRRLWANAPGRRGTLRRDIASGDTSFCRRRS